MESADQRSTPPGEPRAHTHFITEYLALLLRWKRFALLLWGAIVLVALAEAVFLPPVYRSEARILPVGDQALLTNPRLRALSEFTSLIDVSAAGGVGTAALMSLLDSDMLRARVAAELDLAARLGIDEGDSTLEVNLAARRLRRDVTVGINKWDSIIIEAQGRDRRLPIDLLNSILKQLALTQNEMSLTTAQRTREFIAQRIAEAERTYGEAQNALTGFQDRHGMIVVDEQQRAMVRLVAELETQLTLKRAELSAASSFFNSGYGRVRQLNAEIGALEEQLADLKGPRIAATDAAAGSPGERPSLAGLPDLAAEYLRLTMEFEIQARLLTLLAEQHEQAKISEVREVTSFEVIDPPRYPPTAKRTRRGTLLAGVIIGALAALVFPLLFDSLDRYFPAAARRDAADLLRRLLLNRPTS